MLSYDVNRNLQESATGDFKRLFRTLQAGHEQRAGVRRRSFEHLSERSAEEEADRSPARQKNQHPSEVQESLHAHHHSQEH